MSKNLKRLLVAASISMSGIASTALWERLTAEKSGNDTDGVQIAHLKSAVHQVDRKPAKRLIWEPVTEGTKLFAGETIRTSSDAEASVEFENSKARIDLDPDSEIVIEELNGKIELNFLKGNLFVAGGAAGEGGGAGIMLKSGDKSVSLAGSELSLSQNGKGKIDMTVVKGDASLSTATQIKILKPGPNDSLYGSALKADGQGSVPIEFKALPAGYKLVLEAGRKRDELKPLAFQPVGETTGDFSHIEAPFKMGRYFWRLVAKSDEEGKPELLSPTYKLNVLPRTPVVLIKPGKDELVSLEDQDGIGVVWSNPSHLNHLVVEIFKASDPTTSVFSQNIDENMDSLTASIKESGEYLWRVTGHLPNSDESVVSEKRAFRSVAHRELAAPTLIAPKPGEMISFTNYNEKGLELKWSSVAGAVQYKVKVHNKKTNTDSEIEAASTLMKLRDLKPSEFSWSVVAINAKGTVSKPSAINRFNLQALTEIKWTNIPASQESDGHYYTKQPSATLTWEKGPDFAVKWRIRVVAEKTMQRLSDEEQATDATAAPAAGAADDAAISSGQRSVASDADWTEVTATSLTLNIPGNGLYYAEAEALDSRGRVIARSAKRKLDITPVPLIPAPQFDAALGKEIIASGNGSARIAWGSVPQAIDYILVIENKTRGLSTEVRVKENEKQLSKLMPGRYLVTLRSVDQAGRPGPLGEGKTLIVPNTSGVRAPKLKKFNFQ